MLENDELSDAGGRLLVGSTGMSFKPGAYTRTKSLTWEKSLYRGMWDRMDWVELAWFATRSIFGFAYSMLMEPVLVHVL